MSRMMIRAAGPIALATLGLLVTAPSLVGARGVPDGPNRLFALLSGANEVPGPGDPNGHGAFVIQLRPATNRVCHSGEWSRIRNPVLAGHIHKGRAGVAGDVKVTLIDGPTNDSSEGCTRNVSDNLIENLRDHPGRFYVNLHNEPYPDGAIRGQLRQHPPGD